MENQQKERWEWRIEDINMESKEKFFLKSRMPHQEKMVSHQMDSLSKAFNYLQPISNLSNKFISNSVQVMKMIMQANILRFLSLIDVSVNSTKEMGHSLKIILPIAHSQIRLWKKQLIHLSNLSSSNRKLKMQDERKCSLNRAAHMKDFLHLMHNLKTLLDSQSWCNFRYSYF
jgi:hypothetical protein